MNTDDISAEFDIYIQNCKDLVNELSVLNEKLENQEGEYEGVVKELREALKNETARRQILEQELDSYAQNNIEELKNLKETLREEITKYKECRKEYLESLEEETSTDNDVQNELSAANAKILKLEIVLSILFLGYLIAMIVY